MWSLTGSGVPATTIASGEMVSAGGGRTAAVTGEPVSGTKGVKVSAAGTCAWRVVRVDHYINVVALGVGNRFVLAFQEIHAGTSELREPQVAGARSAFSPERRLQTLRTVGAARARKETAGA